MARSTLEPPELLQQEHLPSGWGNSPVELQHEETDVRTYPAEILAVGP